MYTSSLLFYDDIVILMKIILSWYDLLKYMVIHIYKKDPICRNVIGQTWMYLDTHTFKDGWDIKYHTGKWFKGI